MTEPERRAARILIDQARRDRIDREKESESRWEPAELCAYCNEPLNPLPKNRHKQRFCCNTHRTSYNKRAVRLREKERRLSLDPIRERVAA